MSNRRGLPASTSMRHDAHFVEELATQRTEAVGQMIGVDHVRPNPSQPRQGFEGLEELVASIQRVGVLEPLLVRRAQHGYQIVSGERRYRASRAAGLQELPCIVLEVDDARALEIALIENLQRQDLSPFEEAEGLQALVDQFGFTHEDVALRVSKSRSSVTETLTLTGMPRAARKTLMAGAVRSKSLLLELVRIGDTEEIVRLADRVVREHLTRDDLRKLRRAAKQRAAAATGAVKAPPNPPRRLTYRCKNGITVTVYLGNEQVSLADVERALLESIRDLRSNGIPTAG